MLENIILPEKFRCQMIEHAKAAAPLEAVGMVGGSREGIVQLVIELPNLAGKDEFFADPFAQFQAERQISESGLELIAIYHSHPGGGLGLSKADIIAASHWQCAQIVIVPERNSTQNENMRCYRVLEEHSVIDVIITTQ